MPKITPEEWKRTGQNLERMRRLLERRVKEDERIAAKKTTPTRQEKP